MPPLPTVRVCPPVPLPMLAVLLLPLAPAWTRIPLALRVCVPFDWMVAEDPEPVPAMTLMLPLIVAVMLPPCSSEGAVAFADPTLRFIPVSATTPPILTKLFVMLTLPVPLAVSGPFAVLALSARPELAPVAVMLALLMLTLFEAVSISVVFAFHETTSFTFTLPLPTAPPLLLCNVTLVVPRLVEKSVPVVPPPLAATVKSLGSISQVPALPLEARVLTRAVSAILTFAPDVSIKPPSPDWLPPLALMPPST